jgi:hypothetical protein
LRAKNALLVSIRFRTIAPTTPSLPSDRAVEALGEPAVNRGQQFASLLYLLWSREPEIVSANCADKPPHLSDSQATAAKGQSYPQVGYNWPYWFPFIETQF